MAPSHKHFKFCLPQMPCDNAHVFLLVLRSWCLLHSESRAVVKAQFHNVFKLTVKDGINCDAPRVAGFSFLKSVLCVSNFFVNSTLGAGS